MSKINISQIRKNTRLVTRDGRPARIIDKKRKINPQTNNADYYITAMVEDVWGTEHPLLYNKYLENPVEINDLFICEKN